MKKSQIVLVITLSIVGIAVGAAVQQTEAFSLLQKKNSSPSDKPEPPKIPDVIFYSETFSLLAKLKNISDYKAEAELDDVDAETLLKLAERCEKEVQDVDSQAQKLIVTLEESSANRPSQEVPRPPQELVRLQTRRNEIILNYRNMLRQILGETKFTKFGNAAQKLVHITISPAK